MKIVIDIPKDMYDCAQKGYLCGSLIIVDAIRNGTPYEDRPQGEWIDDDNYYANCSCCGYQMDTHEEHGYFKFCPNCGADMKGCRE